MVLEKDKVQAVASGRARANVAPQIRAYESNAKRETLADHFWLALLTKTSERFSDVDRVLAIGVLRNGFIGDVAPAMRCRSEKPHSNNTAYQDLAAGLDRYDLKSR